MRLVLMLTGFALAALYIPPAAAQGSTAYWCEAARAFYPAVGTCPVPWQVFNPATVSPGPYHAAQPMPFASGFPAHRDTIDEWCAMAKLPSSLAICSEPELRTLAVERQQAYDGATAKLNPDQQKALLADQNGWVKSYPFACGLSAKATPSLPLAPEIKKCMAQAGRARIAYLHAYNASAKLAASPLTAVAPDVGELKPGDMHQTINRLAESSWPTVRQRSEENRPAYMGQPPDAGPPPHGGAIEDAKPRACANRILGKQLGLCITKLWYLDPYDIAMIHAVQSHPEIRTTYDCMDAVIANIARLRPQYSGEIFGYREPIWSVMMSQYAVQGCQAVSQLQRLVPQISRLDVARFACMEGFIMLERYVGELDRNYVGGEAEACASNISPH